MHQHGPCWLLPPRKIQFLQNLDNCRELTLHVQGTAHVLPSPMGSHTQGHYCLPWSPGAWGQTPRAAPVSQSPWNHSHWLNLGHLLLPGNHSKGFPSLPLPPHWPSAPPSGPCGSVCPLPPPSWDLWVITSYLCNGDCLLICGPCFTWIITAPTLYTHLICLPLVPSPLFPLFWCFVLMVF